MINTVKPPVRDIISLFKNSMNIYFDEVTIFVIMIAYHENNETDDFNR